MAFAQVASQAGGFGSGSNNTTQTIGMPSGVASGDLLIVAMQCFGTPTPTFPAGWTQIYTVTSSTIKQFAFYKVSDGTEGASISVTLSSDDQCAYKSVRITGHDAATAPEGATSTGVSSGTPTTDPPSLNPSGWDVEDTLWLAFGGTGYTTTSSIGAYPSGYTNTGQGGGSPGCRIGFASKENAASSENPGAFSISCSPSSPACAATVAVRPSQIVPISASRRVITVT